MARHKQWQFAVVLCLVSTACSGKDSSDSSEAGGGGEDSADTGDGGVGAVGSAVGASVGCQMYTL